MLILMISIPSSSIPFQQRTKRAQTEISQKWSLIYLDLHYRNWIVNKCRMDKGNLFINYSALFSLDGKSIQISTKITSQFNFVWRYCLFDDFTAYLWKFQWSCLTLCATVADRLFSSQWWDVVCTAKLRNELLAHLGQSCNEFAMEGERATNQLMAPAEKALRLFFCCLIFHCQLEK